jgi:hypothetical protein
MMSIMVHGKTVLFFTVNEGSYVTKGVITHDRVAALKYCDSLGEDLDPEATTLLREQLLKDRDVPAVSTDEDLVIPEDLLGEFAELVFVGSNVCDDAVREEGEDPLGDLLGEHRLLYSYVNGPTTSETPSIGLVIFTDAEGEIVAIIIRSATEIPTLLEDLRHFDEASRERVRKAMETLPRTKHPLYDLDPCTAETLAVGYLTRVKHESSTRASDLETASLH